MNRTADVLVRFGRSRSVEVGLGHKAGKMPACVCLRGRAHSRVEVPARRDVHSSETEGYCVVATRGGELPEVNNPSVTK